MKRSNKIARRIFVKNTFKKTGVTFNQFEAILHKRYSNNARKYAGKKLDLKTEETWLKMED